MRRKIVVTVIVLIIFPLLAMGCTYGEEEIAEVHVDYAGYWYGTIEDGSSVKEIYGAGFERFSVTSSEITVFIEKGDGGESELTVKIVKGDKVVASGNTFEVYGSVTVKYSS